MSSVLELQVGGDHYKKLAIQPVQLIVKLQLDYFKGNVVKYVTRHRFKNGIEDIKKAIHYCELAKHYMSSMGTNKFSVKTIATITTDYAEKNYLTLLERNAIYYACTDSYKLAIETLNKIIKEYEQ
jgi:hypothetical protein